MGEIRCSGRVGSSFFMNDIRQIVLSVQWSGGTNLYTIISTCCVFYLSQTTSERCVVFHISFTWWIRMSFCLNLNKIYHVGCLTSVLQDTRKLVMDVWQRLDWTDPRLTWDEDAEMVRLPTSEIWTPDIVLYNK